jgi:hypothetical protein
MILNVIYAFSWDVLQRPRPLQLATAHRLAPRRRRDLSLQLYYS